MKFYNKHPKVRDTWLHVKVPPTMIGCDMKSWAQRQTSTGRFYGKYSSWQFEDEADALLFKLRWGYNTA